MDNCFLIGFCFIPKCFFIQVLAGKRSSLTKGALSLRVQICQRPTFLPKAYFFALPPFFFLIPKANPPQGGKEGYEVSKKGNPLLFGALLSPLGSFAGRAGSITFPYTSDFFPTLSPCLQSKEGVTSFFITPLRQRSSPLG